MPTLKWLQCGEHAQQVSADPRAADIEVGTGTVYTVQNKSTGTEPVVENGIMTGATVRLPGRRVLCNSNGDRMRKESAASWTKTCGRTNNSMNASQLQWISPCQHYITALCIVRVCLAAPFRAECPLLETQAKR